MARQPEVTRTITTTTAKVMCLDIVLGESVTKDVVLSGAYKDDAHVLKAARKVIESDNLKAVHVISFEKKEALYAMTEQKFVELAEERPLRVKATDTNSTNAENNDTNTENK